MITLYSYPELFGVADNNGYGLKVFAFLRLAGVPFTQQHIFDASAAPRGQLPYIDDDGEAIGDSDTIIAHLTRKYRLTIDDGLTAAQRDTGLLIARLLDDLYWVMSYSRWKDEQFWPAFRDALRREHPPTTRASAASRRPPPTRAGSRTCGCWRTSSRRAATCTGRNRPAAMPPSTASSPMFISTRSTPRSGSSSRRTPISSGVAPPSTRRSVRRRRREAAAAGAAPLPGRAACQESGR